MKINKKDTSLLGQIRTKGSHFVNNRIEFFLLLYISFIFMLKFVIWRAQLAFSIIIQTIFAFSSYLAPVCLNEELFKKIPKFIHSIKF